MKYYEIGNANVNVVTSSSALRAVQKKDQIQRNQKIKILTGVPDAIDEERIYDLNSPWQKYLKKYSRFFESETDQIKNIFIFHLEVIITLTVKPSSHFEETETDVKNILWHTVVLLELSRATRHLFPKESTIKALFESGERSDLIEKYGETVFMQDKDTTPLIKAIERTALQAFASLLEMYNYLPLWQTYFTSANAIGRFQTFIESRLKKLGAPLKKDDPFLEENLDVLTSVYYFIMLFYYKVSIVFEKFEEEKSKKLALENLKEALCMYLYILKKLPDDYFKTSIDISLLSSRIASAASIKNFSIKKTEPEKVEFDFHAIFSNEETIQIQSSSKPYWQLHDIFRDEKSDSIITLNNIKEIHRHYPKLKNNQEKLDIIKVALYYFTQEFPKYKKHKALMKKVLSVINLFNNFFNSKKNKEKEKTKIISILSKLTQDHISDAIENIMEDKPQENPEKPQENSKKPLKKKNNHGNKKTEAQPPCSSLPASNDTPTENKNTTWHEKVEAQVADAFNRPNSHRFFTNTEKKETDQKTQDQSLTEAANFIMLYLNKKKPEQKNPTKENLNEENLTDLYYTLLDIYTLRIQKSHAINKIEKFFKWSEDEEIYIPKKKSGLTFELRNQFSFAGKILEESFDCYKPCYIEWIEENTKSSRYSDQAKSMILRNHEALVDKFILLYDAMKERHETIKNKIKKDEIQRPSSQIRKKGEEANKTLDRQLERIKKIIEACDNISKSPAHNYADQTIFKVPQKPQKPQNTASCPISKG